MHRRPAGPPGSGASRGLPPDILIRAASPADFDAIHALVDAAKLPTVGLTATALDDHGPGLVAVRGATVVGSAVVEVYDGHGLLRSVAVAPDLRGTGLGQALVQAADDLSRDRGLARLFLLTETAAAFFAGLGFLPVARARVPAAVQASLEFSSVCPASALVMARRTGPLPAGDGVRARAARATDVEAIAAIYNAGIEERVATFETRPRTAADVRAWLDGRHPVVVLEVIEPDGATRVVAFAATSAYRPRACYDGVAEFSVYVARDQRGRGLGRRALAALEAAAREAGFWKLLSRIFVENTASRRLMERAGFREVGVYERHARLDGAWRDVVIVEKLLDELARAGD
ncbi:MAG: arsinothricin resistance N-acetyltransferase ArsN1 family A [Vicinamibacterales bacterium]